MRQLLQTGVPGLVLLCCSLTAHGQAWSMARYERILQRRPFASQAAARADSDAATVVTVAEPPAFVQGLRVCSFMETDRGLRVGFVDGRAKPPLSYNLYIGEEQDGIVLVDADFSSEVALLRKGNEQFWLGMDGAAEASGSLPTGLSEDAAREAKPLELSFRERRERRLAEVRRRAEERRLAEQQREAELSAEQLERRLQKYQMELLRQGKTPLPMITLTPEMDDQLVAEGVLPPRD